MGDRPFRVLPKVTPATEHFWRGGRDGELRILRCQACGHWLHPPAPVCGYCLSRDLSPEAASGRGVVYTFTLNHQEWNPTMSHPYVVALVELAEQKGLRLVANIVECDPEDVSIGMEVVVRFEEHDEVWLPMFAPVAAPGDPR